MVTKTHLDFILNPVVSVAMNHLSNETCLLPNWGSDSPNSVSGWNGEQTVLTELLHSSTFCRKRAALQPLGAMTTNKKVCMVLPSIFMPDSCAATSSEGESSELDSPNKLKKKTRLCKEKGCTSLAVSRRSCVRHGGGSRCTFEGCINGAKLRNRCFQHGGSTICLAADCNSKAKRYGYCWSHGGGRICSSEGCVKVAAQGGSCWAHGGGNRCKLDRCKKRSYQKYGYYCKAHAAHNV